MPKGTCSVVGCEKPAKYVALCGMHHERKRLHGDVGGAEQLRRTSVIDLGRRDQIALTRGKIALVDEEDYDRVMAVGIWGVLRLHHSSTGWEKFYAVHSIPKGDGSYGTIYMHRFIMGAESGKEVDHIDGNGLNNQRSNLRIATSAHNSWNMASSRGTSQYKGVSWYRDRSNWRVTIAANGEWHHLGYFDDEEAAARAWDKVARELHGEFAVLNFPDEA